MSLIAVISPHVDRWSAFTEALVQDFGMEVLTFTRGAAALAEAKVRRPSAVVADAGMADLSTVELVRGLMSIDVMINVAIASDQPEASFHEETEGLGIIMQLSPRPGRKDAADFAAKLKQLNVS